MKLSEAVPNEIWAQTPRIQLAAAPSPSGSGMEIITWENGLFNWSCAQAQFDNKQNTLLPANISTQITCTNI